MIDLVVDNATLLTMSNELPAGTRGHLAVDRGRILHVGPGDSGHNARERIDAAGGIVMPGFVSAHSHLWQSGLTALAPNEQMPQWLDALYEDATKDATADWFGERTKCGARNHLKAGITTAFNFTMSPNGSSDAGVAQALATVESGLRVVHGISVGWPMTARAENTIRDRIRAEQQLFGQHPDSLLGVAIAGLATYRDDGGAQARFEARLMTEFGLTHQQHFLESPDDSETERARFRWLAEAGLLGPDLTFGHFIHVTDEILHRTARAGAAMSWNPMSNGRLASGIAPIPRILEHGIRVGMGVDGEASSDRTDPFENMRAGLYQLRASTQRADVLTPSDVLHMHTQGAADVIGVGDRVGSLGPGKYADFLMLDPSLELIGAPADTVVLACGVTDVVSTFVGGRLSPR